MGRHSFIRQFKLRDVRGRVDYISNPKRQEHLYAAYSTVEPEFWKYLAEQNQYDFKRSRTRGECIEARELVIALPKSLQEYSPEKLLKLFTEQFRTIYGVQCSAALHHNKTKSNYHIHLIYSERKLLEKPERKAATRNMFYDEQGRHVRTKKEILAEDGKTIRPGCRIIPKGEIYEMNFFDAKEEVFKSKDFLITVKALYTDLINKMVLKESEKLSVFDPTGPYLATKKIGKNNPKEAVIKADNAARQDWNRAVDEALVTGVPSEEIAEVKKIQIQQKVKKSVQEHGQAPGILRKILANAVAKLREKIQIRELPKVKTVKVDMEEFMQMQKVYQSLCSIQKSLKSIDSQIKKKQNRLDQLTGLAGVFKGSEKRKLMNEISSLMEKRDSQSNHLKKTVKKSGYRNVDAFMKAYHKAEQLVSEYKKLEKSKMETEKKMQKKKKSIHDRLKKANAEAKERKADGLYVRKKRIGEIEL